MSESISRVELIQFVNCTKTTFIEADPIMESGDWALHSACHRIQSDEYPFQVVFCTSSITLKRFEELSGYVKRKCNIILQPSARVDREKVLGLFPTGSRLFTPSSYLHSFFQDEIATYLSNLRSKEYQKFYIHPTLRRTNGDLVNRKDSTDELVGFLRERSGFGGSGEIAIVLGEPGQGKTYLTKFIASKLATTAKSGGIDPVVPLFVSSEQWKSLGADALADFPKLILNCFKYYDAHVHWLDGVEERFLRVILKANFVVIFDGFDELILQSKGEQTPSEVIERIQELCIDTNLKIIITSRTSFWNYSFHGSEIQVLRRSGLPVNFTLLEAFEDPQAELYFDQFFQGLEDAPLRKDQAMKMYRLLRNSAVDLSGRGFVLHLIGSHVILMASRSLVRPITGDGGLRWLIKMMSERDVRRQELPFDKDEQFTILRRFAVESASGTRADTELLILCMEETKDFKSEDQRRSAAKSMVSHPILARHPSADYWEFSEPQCKSYLIADYLIDRLSINSEALGQTVSSLSLTSSEIFDVTVTIARIFFNRNELSFVEECSGFIRGCRIGGAERLGGRFLMNAIEVVLPRGEGHKQRTDLLIKICGGDKVEGMFFGGAIPRFDFSSIEFLNCRFSEVYFVGCSFSGETIFNDCQFEGGSIPERCSGFGLAQWKMCVIDESARGWVDEERVRSGDKKYDEINLRGEIASVINKFISRGGFGFSSVIDFNLGRGVVGRSKHKEKIIDSIKKQLLVEHKIAGKSDRGWHVSDHARTSLQFFSDNNVFEGPLLELYESLRAELCK